MRSREVPSVCLLALVCAAAACGGGDAPATTDGGVTDGRFGSTSPDAMLTCPADPPTPAECDFFLGCGCVEMGQKCTVQSDMRTCTAIGAGNEGAPCVSETDCGDGTMCVNWSGERRCRVFCDETHACEVGWACYLRIVDDAVPPNVLATVCAPTCSLLDQDCALPGQGCYTSDNVDEIEQGSCATAGTGVQGDPCERGNDCAAGHLCINPSGAGANLCASICDRADGDPGCAAGACTELPGHTITGVCLTP
jgi:hypothetical protein